MLAACGAKKPENAVKTEKASEAVEIEDEADGEEAEDEPEIDEIDQDAADKALAEKLEGLGCRTVFSEYTEADGVDVYVYSVVNKKEEELDEMLAVNAVSGEVMVYDLDNEKLLPFESFSLLNDNRNAAVSWDARYYLKPRTIELMPADDNSFEFTVTKDGVKEPELFGVAEIDKDKKNEAVYDDGKVSLTFTNRGDTLEISEKGNSGGVAGIYSRQE